MSSLEKNVTWSLTKLPARKKNLQNKWVFRIKEEHDGRKRYKVRMTVQQHIYYVNNNRSAELSTVNTSNGPLILVGEWVAEWGIKAIKDDYQRFGSAQLDSVEKGNLGVPLLPGQGCSFHSFRTNTYKLSFMESPSGMKVRTLNGAGAAEGAIDAANIFEHALARGEVQSLYLALATLENILGSILTARDRLLKPGGLIIPSRAMDEGEKEFSKVPYASAVGSLMYAMVCTRPDIAHAVRVKWFSDANFGGYLDMRKSTTGYILTLGGTAVSWMSRIQKSVALSTTEAEYMAISEARRR
ncbi:hypothetical protein AgCh_017606 [Apium graveolens]